MEMTHPTKIRVVEPFIALIVFIMATIYLINVFNTGNWMWFQNNNVNVRPSRIIILDHGQRTIIQAGHPAFNDLADAAAASLSKLNNTDLVNIGLSDQTMTDYATDSLIVELYYDSPVVFGGIARTGKPTQLLIPINGRHAGGGYVFRGDQGEWWFGAVRMAEPQYLLQALESIGYTVQVSQPSS